MPLAHSHLTTSKMSLSILSMMNDSWDIAHTVSHFLTDQYLNTAGINRTWRQAYRGLPKTTRGVDKDTTVEQFMDHLKMGHGRCAPTAPPNPRVYRPPSRVMSAQKPCSVAASLGRVDLLQAAYESGMAKKDTTACEGAALNGELQTLKYLRFIECPWDHNTAHAAAKGGHLELLQWVINNGCPSNNGTQLYAASEGNLEMVAWLYWNGHPVTPAVLNAAVYAGSTDIIMWARSVGIEYASTFSTAIESGKMEIVRYLGSTRHPWDGDQLMEIVQYGRIDVGVVTWLRKHGYIF